MPPDQELWALLTFAFVAGMAVLALIVSGLEHLFDLLIDSATPEEFLHESTKED